MRRNSQLQLQYNTLQKWWDTCQNCHISLINHESGCFPNSISNYFTPSPPPPCLTQCWPLFVPAQSSCDFVEIEKEGGGIFFRGGAYAKWVTRRVCPGSWQDTNPRIGHVLCAALGVETVLGMNTNRQLGETPGCQLKVGRADGRPCGE